MSREIRMTGPCPRRSTGYLHASMRTPALAVVSMLLATLSAPAQALGAPTGEPEPIVRHDGEVVVRVRVRSAQDLMLISQLSDDAWTHAPGVGGTSDWRLAADRLPALRASGMPFEVIIPDLQALVQGERDRLAQPQEAADWFADFKDLAAINARLDALVAARPDLCSIVNLPVTTIQGRTIKGIRISRHPSGTAMPAFAFTGTQHAREWGGTMTAMWIVDRLVEDADTDARVGAILDASEVFVFPVMNPDGYLYSWSTNRLWRKNRRLNSGGSYGVDLNRNWGWQWGGQGASTQQSNETYRGTAAFSEPETRAYRDWATPRTNIAAHLDIHSYSELLLWPWGYTGALCPDQASFSRVGTAMHDAILSMDGHDYLAGPVYTTIYPASGGVNDWAYGSLGHLSYCVEVRDTGTYGFVMPPAEILPNARENFAGALALMEETLKACTIALSSGPGASMPADTAAPVRVSVTANVGALLAANPVRLKWQVNGGAVQSANMTLASGLWGANLPATACGGVLRWWVEAETNFSVSRWPSSGAASGRDTSTGACGIEGDLDGDGSVGGGDLSILLLDYGPCPGCASDLDGTGMVDFGDVAYLLLLFN